MPTPGGGPIRHPSSPGPIGDRGTADRSRADVLLQLGRLAGEMPLEQFLAEAVGLLESVVASPEAAIYRMDEQQRFMVLCSTRPESVAQLFFPDGHVAADIRPLLPELFALHPMVLNDVESLPASALALRPNLRRALCVPLVANGVPVAFAVAADKAEPYTADDVDSLLLVANLLLRIVEREDARRRAEAEADERQRMMWGVVDALLRVTEARDPYTAGHQRSVAVIAARIGRQLGLDARTVEGLRVIGSLHDIGKLAVPTEILVRPGALSSLEREFIQQHVRTGADLLGDLPFPWPVGVAVLQHHERLDGSGYPSGAAGDEIILEARVVAVADVLDAMSSPRPYRTVHSIALALAELRSGAGVRYDADVVSACLAVVTAESGVLPTHE